MSSRVRIIGSHPTYGVAWGGQVVHYIEDSWAKKFKLLDINQVAPMGFQAWTHWKRALWMAKKEGGWAIKAFREPREARMSRSQYGKAFMDWGIVIPKRKVKFIKKGYKVGYKFKVGVNKPAQPRVHVVEPRMYFDNEAVREIIRDINDIGGLNQGQMAIPVPGPNGDVAAAPQVVNNVAFQEWGWANMGAQGVGQPVAGLGYHERILQEQRRRR